MDTNVPYIPSVKNLHKILDCIQKAAVPDGFNNDFIKDLGFTSSNDRSVIKILRYLGMIDSSGKPQSSYSDFMDHTKGKGVLANRLKAAYDDLFNSQKDANTKTPDQLKGWFKTKTGAGDSAAHKMAMSFKKIAEYADFQNIETAEEKKQEAEQKKVIKKDEKKIPEIHKPEMSLVYRLEIHLPDTTNIETFRSIFKAIREELIQ